MILNYNILQLLYIIYYYDFNTLMLGVFKVLIEWTVVTTAARVVTTEFFKQGMETVL